MYLILLLQTLGLQKCLVVLVFEILGNWWKYQTFFVRIVILAHELIFVQWKKNTNNIQVKKPDAWQRNPHSFRPPVETHKAVILTFIFMLSICLIFWQGQHIFQ